MARRRRRRPAEAPEPVAPKTRSSIVRLSYPDQDTMRLRTFWSPLPNWSYGAIPAAIVALIAVLTFGGSDPLGAAIIGAAAGYFGGGILWAVLGVIGGDVLEVDFDLEDDTASVRQSMLWMVNRQWSFELYDVETITMKQQRSRPLLLQFSGSHSAHIAFADGHLMRIGRFPTHQEALDLGTAVSDFIGVQLLQPDEEDSRRRGRR
jgi:prepilin-type processing-associated H-X9-DG protein